MSQNNLPVDAVSALALIADLYRQLTATQAELIAAREALAASSPPTPTEP